MSVINKAYERDAGRCSGPIYFPGEVYSFYLNLNQPTSDPNFANFRLDLRPLGDLTPIATGIGGLDQDMISSGFYNILSTFLFPDVVPGWYQFAIYDAVNDITKALSGPVQCEVEAETINTAIVSFRHKIDLYGIRYEANPDFFNRVRLPLIQLGPIRADVERKQYRNVSNRRWRNYITYKDELATIETYYADESLHLAISDIYQHDTIFLNQTFITPKEPYQYQERNLSKLSKGSIVVIVDDTISLDQALLDQVGEFDSDFGDEFN